MFRFTWDDCARFQVAKSERREKCQIQHSQLMFDAAESSHHVAAAAPALLRD
jgi:flagellar biosynthesis regulator FlaF